MVDFSGSPRSSGIELTEPLMLTGRVRHRGVPLGGALVTLSAHTGEVRVHDQDRRRGRDTGCGCRRPGHNILTVLAAGARCDTQATKIFTTTQSAVADVDLEPAASESDVLAQ